MYHALRRHGVPDSDLEDLVQEVFLVMWRRWAQYDPSRPVRPWLAGISFRVAYNHRQRAHREVPRGFVDLEDPQPDPEQSMATDSARTLVRRVLASLPEKHRTLIVSHDVDGISVREIAETLDVPIPTAHTRLRAARKAFAKALKRLQVVSAARARPGAAAAAGCGRGSAGGPAGREAHHPGHRSGGSSQAGPGSLPLGGAVARLRPGRRGRRGCGRSLAAPGAQRRLEGLAARGRRQPGRGRPAGGAGAGQAAASGRKRCRRRGNGIRSCNCAERHQRSAPVAERPRAARYSPRCR